MALLRKNNLIKKSKKGMANVKAGRVYSADAIETEMEGEKTTE